MPATFLFGKYGHIKQYKGYMIIFRQTLLFKHFNTFVKNISFKLFRLK